MRMLLIVALIVIVGGGCSGSNGDTSPPSAPPGDGALAPGWHEQGLQHDGVERRFRLLLPESASGVVPVVILLHGGRGSMYRVVDADSDGSAEWPVIAEEAGFLLVIPNGTNVDTGEGVGEDQSWNDCRPFGSGGPDSSADDVGFLAALIDALPSRLGEGAAVLPDFDRVFVTGVSNGGMMSYRVAEEHPERIAGIAAFIANRPEPSECTPRNLPVGIFIANGTEDPLMPWEGGTIGFNRGTVSSAVETRDYWLAVNRVGPDPGAVIGEPDRDPSDGSVVVCEHYPAATGDSAPVRFCRVEGGGHSVPSRVHEVPGRQNRDVEGARLAWAFLEAL